MMSQQNVEVARAALDARNRGDLEAWLSLWDEEAEFYPLRAELEGSGYHGHQGLRRFTADNAEDWEGVRFEVDEIRDAVEQVVAVGRTRTRGRASGVEFDVPIGMVGIVRDGRLAYFRFFSNPAEALEAAGLEE
jgi:ketosteroid isomerase-like protein